MTSIEIIDALKGTHAAQKHAIDSISDIITTQAEENLRLKEERDRLKQDVEYWRYQLDIHGIALLDPPSK